MNKEEMEIEQKTEPAVGSNDRSEMKKEIKGFRKMRILRIWYVRFMAFLLISFFLFALLLPLRPRHSETENRNLTPFPRFSFAALFSGEFFDEIAVWYADTFPLRDAFVSLNAHLSGSYGQNKIRIEGKVNVADEIPDAPSATESTESKTEDLTSSAADTAVGSDRSGTASDPASTVSQKAEPETSSAVSAPEKAPQYTAQTIDDAILLYGDTAFEYYNFVRKYADDYIATVNRAASLLKETATVYDMIVPTSMGITAPEKITASIQTSDQNKAIRYMYGSMAKTVKTVPLYDALKSHKNEYIYFRTDHHWTALGAYYAYVQFMNVKGEKPVPLSAYTEQSFPGYLGSFYSSSKKAPALAANPDTVYAYQPPSTNACDILFKESKKWQTSEIISDISASPYKYITFIKGDNPITHIQNPNKKDKSVCLLIKESFGNAFAPFPVENYQDLYVVDYRYFAQFDKRGLAQYCKDIKGSSLDVIFLNNISATRNRSLIDSLSYFVR